LKGYGRGIDRLLLGFDRARQDESSLGLEAQRLKLQQLATDRRAVVVAKLDRVARDAELVLRLAREADRNGIWKLFR
jgi:hypothetical protein